MNNSGLGAPRLSRRQYEDLIKSHHQESEADTAAIVGRIVHTYTVVGPNDRYVQQGLARDIPFPSTTIWDSFDDLAELRLKGERGGKTDIAMRYQEILSLNSYDRSRSLEALRTEISEEADREFKSRRIRPGFKKSDLTNQVLQEIIKIIDKLARPSTQKKLHRLEHEGQEEIAESLFHDRLEYLGKEDLYKSESPSRRTSAQTSTTNKPASSKAQASKRPSHTPEERLIINLSVPRRGNRSKNPTEGVSLAHVFATEVAKEVSSLEESPSDIAKLLIKHLHPSVIREFLERKAVFDGNNSLQMIIERRNDFQVTNFGQELNADKKIEAIAKEIRDHIHKHYLPEETAVKDALLNDFRETFTANIPENITKAIVNELHLNMKKTSKEEMNSDGIKLLSACFDPGYNDTTTKKNRRKVKMTLDRVIPSTKLESAERRVLQRASKNLELALAA